MQPTLRDRPRTGDVFIANLEPVTGSEQGRRRPVVVFQTPDLDRFTTTYLCIPLTTNPRRLGVPGTCFLAAGDGGLREDSIALAFQLRALDRTRLTEKLGSLNPESVDALATAILNALGLTPDAPTSSGWRCYAARDWLRPGEPPWAPRGPFGLRPRGSMTSVLDR